MQTDPLTATKTVLVTGATGYIGGRLVPRLLESGYRVRCLARDPSRLQGRPWLGQVEVVAGDCLRAEMKVPGRAGLEFEVEPVDAATSRLSQTAFFAPRGLFGLVYWYLLYPIHALIFSGLTARIAGRTERAVRETPG